MARILIRLAVVLWGVSLMGLLAVRLLDGGQFGNPILGADLYYSSRLGCVGCHRDGVFGPPMEGVARRVQEIRLPQNPGVSAAQYIAESIIDPPRYIVPGYSGDTMPHYTPSTTYFGLTIGELRDLVAYLMTR